MHVLLTSGRARGFFRRKVLCFLRNFFFFSFLGGGGTVGNIIIYICIFFPLMTKQVVFRAPPTLAKRREPLLMTRQECSTSREGSRKRVVGEVVGGTAAECAAICCCCPCGLVNLLVLAVYKVPAGLCRKVLRRKRTQKATRQGFLQPRRCGCHDYDLVQVRPLSDLLSTVNAVEAEDKDVVELEKEMWDKFYSAGFWRSPSQKNEL